jgi:hypothetical protein
MRQCEQSSGQNILQHGEAVAVCYKQLITGDTSGWRLPDWFISHGQELIKLSLPDDVMETYHVYHDCGKPYCRQVDDAGRTHFPNHAQVSAGVWRVNGGSGLIAELIQSDMDMHLLKPADAGSYQKLHLAPALLLTALSEIHANAAMFGGIESTSFKIKWKCLNKLGKAFLPLIFKE